MPESGHIRSIEEAGADRVDRDVDLVQLALDPCVAALLGVSQGSANQPKLIVLRWQGGDEKAKPYALVGKGALLEMAVARLAISGGSPVRCRTSTFVSMPIIDSPHRALAADASAHLSAAGRRVLVRADLNVPQDEAGHITEDTRIRASVPAIRCSSSRASASSRQKRTPCARPRRSALLMTVSRLAMLVRTLTPLAWLTCGLERARRTTSSTTSSTDRFVPS